MDILGEVFREERGGNKGRLGVEWLLECSEFVDEIEMIVMAAGGDEAGDVGMDEGHEGCLLYTSPSPRDS